MQDTHIFALRNARRATPLSQEDVANVLGATSRDYVGLLEAGKREPSYRDLAILSALYDKPTAELLPEFHQTMRDDFVSNLRGLIEDEVAKGDGVNKERLAFLRDRLQEVELVGNVEQSS